MLFKVTHIDPAGHCRKARVSAPHAGDAFDQMDRQFGEGAGGLAVRLPAKTVAELLAATAKDYGLEMAA